MNIEALYPTTNPTGDELVIWDRHTRVCRIHDQSFLELLGPRQKAAWFNGQYRFNLPAGKLKDACKRWYL